MNADLLDVLTEARELVRREWGTGNLRVPLETASGNACASVAISMAAEYDRTTAMHAHRAIVEAIGCVPAGEDHDLYRQVWNWNDEQPNRAPVLAAFDRAIADVEAAA